MNIKKYKWTELDQDMIKLVRRIRYANFKPRTIIGLARGGLIPGVVMSHKLKVPLLIISATSYQGQKRGTLAFNASFTKPLKSPVLVIDDIADSGETMSSIHQYVSSMGVVVKTATLFYKERSICKPDWYMNKIEDSVWCVFPWEESINK